MLRSKKRGAGNFFRRDRRRLANRMLDVTGRNQRRGAFVFGGIAVFMPPRVQLRRNRKSDSESDGRKH